MHGRTQVDFTLSQSNTICAKMQEKDRATSSLVPEFLGELWIHSVCLRIFDPARLQILFLTQFVVLQGKGLLKVRQRIVGMVQGLTLSGGYIVHYYGQLIAYPPSA